MFNGIIIDGNEYDMIVSAKRKAKLEQSDNVGLLMDRHYHNDIIGTYFEYDISLAVPTGKEYEYVALYNVLTDPVAEHDFILPYNNHYIAIKGRVEEVSDEYYHKEGTKQIWKGISFTVIATKPSK